MGNKLIVILGAGFSANAAMPTAAGIAERFNRDLREKLIRFSSSEWAWTDDKSEIDLNNGTLNFDYLAYSYVFNELIRRYLEERGSFVYYEDFYQFIIDKFQDYQWVEDVFKNAKCDLLKDRPYLNDNNYNRRYLFAFDTKQFSNVSAIVNYLIYDLLWKIPKADEELLEIYKGFITYLKRFDQVEIFTLNHDLLLEHLFDIHQIRYSRGFNFEGSPLFYKGKAVQFFNNKFTEDFKIHKLHGSIDFFRFDYFFQGDQFYLEPTGKYDYYATSDYLTKHGVTKIDSNTGKVVQVMNSDIVPKFITGTRKRNIIDKDDLFKTLFNNYEKCLRETDNLLVSGYSFSDIHLNETLSVRKFNYINHNPGKPYPFEGNGKNIKIFNELI